MHSPFKQAFYYSKAERNGIFILSLLLISIILCTFIDSSPSGTPSDFSAFNKAITQFEAEQKAFKQKNIPSDNHYKLQPFNPNKVTHKELVDLGVPSKVAATIINYRKKGGSFKQKEDLKKIYGLEEATYQQLLPYIYITTPNKKRKPKKQVLKQLKPFKFNPNTASKSVLLKMGLPVKTATQIINYREKGGSFKKASDLKKIYQLAEKHYQALAPFVVIPQLDKNTRTHKQLLAEDKKSTLQLDINQATTSEWKQLPGIGPVYAKTITKFRDKLGGFSSINQVSQTYNLPDSVFRKIQPQLIYSPIYRKIAINEVSMEELKNHPYITPKQAALIINFRINHGAYTGIEDLETINTFSSQWLKKIAPYLSFKNPSLQKKE